MKKVMAYLLTIIMLCTVPCIESGAMSDGTTYLTLSATQNSDITKQLDGMLKYAGQIATDESPVTVMLQRGNYRISGNLHIYSNTTLDMNGSVIEYYGTESKNMIMLGTVGRYKGITDYNRSIACQGYNGFSNVTIKNGTLKDTDTNKSSNVRLAHARNVTFENVVFSGCGASHQIEAAAIDGLYIRNCTFKDYGNDNSTKRRREAIQFDIPCNSKVFGNVYQDGTVMKNVEITGCTFSNIPRGVGSHSMLYGAYHENIKINNNRFVNVREEAVAVLNYYNFEIKDNVIENCGAGILFQYFKPTESLGTVFSSVLDGRERFNGAVRYEAKTVISGNKMKIRYNPKSTSRLTAINVAGYRLSKATKGGDGILVPAGNYYVSGVDIKDNIISTGGRGIVLENTKNCVVSGNTVKSEGIYSKDINRGTYVGITVQDGTTNALIKGNSITGFTRSAIMAKNGATVQNILNNKIKSCKGYGIYIASGSTVLGYIKKNSINGAVGHGILVSSDSRVKRGIVGNKVRNVK